MSASNKVVVQKFFDFYNQAAWDELAGLVSADYVHHSNDSHSNLTQFKSGATWLRTGMPDFHTVVEDILGDGDKVAVRVTGHGTHLGSLYGETPTSKSVVIYIMGIFRIENNLILEDWETLDAQDFMKQIGAPSQES
jgi:predicted ester cyclase